LRILQLYLYSILICLLFQARSNSSLFVCLSFLYVLVFRLLLLILLAKTSIIFLVLIIIIVRWWGYIIGIASSGCSTLRGRRVLYSMGSIVWAENWYIILRSMVLLIVLGFLEVFRILKETLYIDLEMLIIFVLNSDFEGTCLWIIVELRGSSWHYYRRCGSNLSDLSSFCANKFGLLTLSGASTRQWLPLISLPVYARRCNALCRTIILVMGSHNLLVITKELFMNIKITQEWMLLSKL
jgi:hypothetical protein